jgi:hypothetical protein
MVTKREELEAALAQAVAALADDIIVTATVRSLKLSRQLK